MVTLMVYVSEGVRNPRKSVGLVQRLTGVCVLKAAVEAQLIALLALLYIVVLLQAAFAVHKLEAQVAELSVTMVQEQLHAVPKHLGVMSIVLADLAV